MKIFLKVVVVIIVLGFLFKILYPFIMALLGAYLFIKYTLPIVIIIILFLFARSFFKK